MLVDNDIVTNGLAMKVSDKMVYYGPLEPNSRWWRRPLTKLPVEDGKISMMLKVSLSAKEAAAWWIISFNTLRLSYLPIPDVRDSFPSYAFDIYPDASGVHLAGNPMSRGGGVYLETGHFTRVVWPSNEFWRNAFGTNIMFLDAVAALHDFLVASKLNLSLIHI